MKLSNELSIFVARRRWLKRILKNHLPPIASKNIFNKINFHFDPRDMRGPSFHFAYDLEQGFNNYEEVAKNKLLKMLPEDGVFYDIGANIGMYSVYFALHKPQARLYSFEPEASAFYCLSKSLTGFSDKIHLYNKAIGNITEKKKIFKSPLNDGGHSLCDNNDGREFTIVEVVNLDEFRNINKLPAPNVIKIDVEGFELEVLKGMKETILEIKPVMQIESSNEDLASRGEFWYFMNNLETSGLYAMTPESDKQLSMSELSTLAEINLSKGKLLNDYFYCFNQVTL